MCKISYMIKRITCHIVASIIFAAYCQDAVVTNLNDQFHTQIVITNATSFDFARLETNSINVDLYKDKHTNVRSLSIDLPTIRKVLMVKPLNARSNNGKSIKIDNMYVDTLALKQNDIKHAIVDSISTTNLLVNDLSPETLFLDNEHICKVFSIDSLQVVVHNPNMHLDNSTAYVKAIDVVDSPYISKMLVIDNSKFSIDVTTNTYAQLSYLKTIETFENNYINSHNALEEVKLNDIRKLDDKLYARWTKILESNATCNIALVRNKKIRRIAGEAWIFNGMYNAYVKKTMQDNLNFLKAEGYNAVLVRFNCTEDKDLLSKMIDDIKASSFEVFGTYTGLDGKRPVWNPFIQPEVLEEYVAAIAPKLTGFFLNWRTTSNHVRILPIEFFNYMCNTLRSCNSSILIYGEIYFGRIDPLRMKTLMYTIPKNVTGVVINNMGYYGYNTSYIINSLFTQAVPGYRKLDKIGQVIGYGPYYCSRPEHHAHLNLRSEYEYKHAVENAFKRTGYGTVTMLHDGVDDNQTSLVAGQNCTRSYDTTDNILYDVNSMLR